MTEQVLLLVEQLRDHRKRSAARRDLNTRPAEDVVPPLLELLTQSGEADNTIWAAVSILRRLKCEAAVETLELILPQRPNLQFDLKQAIADIRGIDMMAVDNLQAAVAAEDKNYCNAIIASFNSAELISSDVRDDVTYLTLSTNNQRTQKMVLQIRQETLLIHTEAGHVLSEKAEKVLKLNEQLEVGQIDLRPEDDTYSMVVIRAEVLKDISIFDANDVIKRLAQVADSLEEQITGKDEI